MAISLSALLKKEKIYDSISSLANFKDYNVILRYPNRIKVGDIILNAGLTSEIYPEIDKNRIKERILSSIYGISINEKLEDYPNLYSTYKSAVSAAYGKKGLERAMSISNSVYQQLYFRMIEYTDGYSKEKGIITHSDLKYLDEEYNHTGKAVDVDYSLLNGPFLCHEFNITLYLLLEKEKRKIGFEPFYVMGTVEKNGEKAEHCWIELRNKHGNKFLLDRISDVLEPMSSYQNIIVTKKGFIYTIDNGALVLRR
jgi:hypothetical protein